MIGPIFVFGLLAFICYKAIQDPAYGVIGFYGFVTLDPVWNWRWSLPAGIEYQNYLVIATFIGWMLRGFQIGHLAKETKIGLLSLVTLYLWSWVCSFQSIDQSLSEYFMTYFGKIILVCCVGIFTIRSPRQVLALAVVSVLGMGYNAYQINLDYFQTGYARYAYYDWGSKGVDNNGYQLITLPILGLALTFFLHETNLLIKTGWATLVLAMGHQVMLSYSRGGMLGGLAMLLPLAFRIPKGKHNLAYIVPLAMIAVALLGPSVTKEFSTIFESAETRDSSAESRFHLWQAGWLITMDYPIFGTGPNAARRIVASDKYFAGTQRTNNKALHNLFFDFSTGMGIPGFLLAMTFFLIPLTQNMKRIRQKIKPDKLSVIRDGVAIGIIGYMTASMFSSGVLFETAYITTLLGYACLNISDLPGNQTHLAKAFN